MKVALLGAGGTRVPLLMNGLLKRANAIGLEEISLVETDDQRLSLMGQLLAYQVERSEENVRLTPSSLEDGLRDAAFVFSAIRVGGIPARILDEQIPLSLGVLGQETTGPGGMAMALRTIPVAIEIVQKMREVAPAAWLLNFTNPSGLVTEALSQWGFRRSVGLCDAPSGLTHALADHLGLPRDEIRLTYGGLNHLGWATDVLGADGKSYMADLLDKADETCRQVRPLNPFSGDLLRHLGALPNEYLVYYYEREKALKGLLDAPESRGEELLRREDGLYLDLEEAFRALNPTAAYEAYTRFVAGRRSSYMQRELGRERPVPEQTVFTEEGYEGLALQTMMGFLGLEPARLILNASAQTPLGARAVVETAFRVDEGLAPEPWPELPAHARSLVTDVKAYELLTIRAATQGDRKAAVEALLVHPLVGDHPKAEALVEKLLSAHRSHLPQFH